MNQTALRVERLSKQYKIVPVQHRHSTLRGVMSDTIGSIFRSRNRSDASETTIEALKSVSFEIEKGEAVGIIGGNGAGKSTLLKILSRITKPSRGRAEIYGAVRSLLEVGTGFSSELSGRENTYLNGAILGMKKTEIDRKFDEIVSFSGVGKFIDTPVKYYSSGMYVRLAFAVAAHMEPDILIVDEVLAVGDASFQKKCMGKMGEVARGGRTILFVSHSMEAIRTLCQRAIWLRDGAVQADGPSDDVVEQYMAGLSDGSFFYENKDCGLIIQKVALRNAKGEETSQFYPGDDLLVEIQFKAEKRLEKPYFLVLVQGNNGTCFTANMLLDGYRPEVLDGAGSITCRFKSIPLLPQRFTVRLNIRVSNGQDAVLSMRDVAYFNVVGKLEEYGYKGEFQMLASRSTPVVIPYDWVLPDGTTASIALNSRVHQTCVAGTKALVL
jgi:lipopolysaccharide transport system ATP-binding protein